MKKLFTILTAVLFTAIVFLPIQQASAQTPQKISYQAVIRNSSNALVTSTAVGMQMSILSGSPTGTLVYIETQTPSTNANGLVSIEIGGGTGFDTITWANGPYFIKTETDPTGSTNYTITGTSQLLSVPYALHAKTAEEIQNPLWFSNLNGINSNEIVGIGTSAPDANLHIIDHTGISPLKMESEDNIYTIWQSNRSGVDDFIVGIDGGNNRFMFANITNSQMLLTLKGAYVGISQPNPQANLDVLGSFKLSNGSQGIGKVLTSDALGNAVWEMPVNAPSHNIGELYGGGIIVAVWKESGVEHGLIASLVDLSTGIIWTTGAYQSITVPGGATSPIDGLANSDAIVAQAGAETTYAAGLCRAYSATGDGGLTDWYLPAAWELNQCYNAAFVVNTILGATNGFQFFLYWSSTEGASNGAWAQNFTNGYSYVDGKSSTNRVRAVRRY